MLNKIFLLFLTFFIPTFVTAKDINIKSKIDTVHLYQNRAKIYRNTTFKLKRGNNKIILTDLPEALYDWSIRGILPKNYPGKILSISVEKKSLIKKRQKKVQEIESKLNKLKEKDKILLDELTSINSQKKFIDSILDFTNETASKELATRIPKIEVWDKTLKYTTKKIKRLQSEKRTIEKKRKDLGKKVQVLEYELSQLVGYKYFQNYQKLNEAIMHNQTSLAVQSFGNFNRDYARKKNLLKANDGKLDIEKRVILNIYSTKEKEINFQFNYIVPNTYWVMRYDIRASKVKRKVNISIHGNINQSSGEDWNDVKLILSTGAPVSSIRVPILSYWFLDIDYPQKKYRDNFSYYKSKKSSRKKGSAVADEMDNSISKISNVPQSSVKQKGSSFEITFPIRQTILSSSKYQKKFIKEFKLEGGKDLDFYYQVVPAKSNVSYLRVKAKNTTSIPWLTGKAQLFFEQEFMGITSLLYTPIKQKRDLVLGVENRITSKKILIKKFEDKSGVFGGNRQIKYSYQITTHNKTAKLSKIILNDTLPISRNKKITVEIKNLNIPFMKDKKTLNSYEYKIGKRKWELKLQPGEKRKINYDVVITFDKETKVKGLK